MRHLSRQPQFSLHLRRVFCISQILIDGANSGFILSVPVAHEDARHAMSSSLEQVSGDGRVDAARHADGHVQPTSPRQFQSIYERTAAT